MLLVFTFHVNITWNPHDLLMRIPYVINERFVQSTSYEKYMKFMGISTLNSLLSELR